MAYESIYACEYRPAYGGVKRPQGQRMEPYHMMPTVRPPPPKELWGQLAEYGTATISSALREECGVTRAYAFGPECVVPGQRLVGLAKTISFLPKREDIIQGLAEEENDGVVSKLLDWWHASLVLLLLFVECAPFINAPCRKLSLRRRQPLGQNRATRQFHPPAAPLQI